MKDGKITVVFHKRLPPTLELYINDKLVECKWHPIRKERASLVWFSNLSVQDCQKVYLKFENDIYNFAPSKENSWISNVNECMGNKSKLVEQLNFYQQLIAMEEGTPYKWARLTKLHLLSKIDFISNHSEILDNLKKIDPLRLNYYKDLSKIKY